MPRPLVESMSYPHERTMRAGWRLREQRGRRPGPTPVWEPRQVIWVAALGLSV